MLPQHQGIGMASRGELTYNPVSSSLHQSPAWRDLAPSLYSPDMLNNSVLASGLLWLPGSELIVGKDLLGEISRKGGQEPGWRRETYRKCVSPMPLKRILYVPAILRRIPIPPIPSQLPLFQFPTCIHSLAEVCISQDGPGSLSPQFFPHTLWTASTIHLLFLANSWLYLQVCPNHSHLWKFSVAPHPW